MNQVKYRLSEFAIYLTKQLFILVERTDINTSNNGLTAGFYTNIN